MTQNFTPITAGAPANAEIVNAPLRQLDSALQTVQAALVPATVETSGLVKITDDYENSPIGETDIALSTIGAKAISAEIDASMQMAEAAQKSANSAQLSANAAQTAAQTAQSSSEAAQTSANSAQSSADTAQASSASAIALANAAQSESVSAKNAATTAQAAASTAQTSADSALTVAFTAKTAADSHASRHAAAGADPVSISKSQISDLPYIPDLPSDVIAGSNITVTDSGSGKIQIDATGGGGGVELGTDATKIKEDFEASVGVETTAAPLDHTHPIPMIFTGTSTTLSTYTLIVTVSDTRLTKLTSGMEFFIYYNKSTFTISNRTSIKINDFDAYAVKMFRSYDVLTNPVYIRVVFNGVNFVYCNTTSTSAHEAYKFSSNSYIDGASFYGGSMFQNHVSITNTAADMETKEIQSGTEHPRMDSSSDRSGVLTNLRLVHGHNRGTMKLSISGVSYDVCMPDGSKTIPEIPAYYEVRIVFLRCGDSTSGTGKFVIITDLGETTPIPYTPVTYAGLDTLDSTRKYIVSDGTNISFVDNYVYPSQKQLQMMYSPDWNYIAGSSATLTKQFRIRTYDSTTSAWLSWSAWTAV